MLYRVLKFYRLLSENTYWSDGLQQIGTFVSTNVESL